MRIEHVEAINMLHRYPEERRFQYGGGICDARLTTLILVRTGVRRGRRWFGVLIPCSRLFDCVDHLDFFQTLAEVGKTELPAETDFPSTSVLPLLLGNEERRDWRDVQFGEYGPVVGVQAGTPAPERTPCAL